MTPERWVIAIAALLLAVGFALGWIVRTSGLRQEWVLRRGLARLAAADDKSRRDAEARS